MGATRETLYYLFHPSQLRNVVQWKMWHEPVHRRDPSKETPTQKLCFRLLDMTSRSFSAVIQELNPELLMPIVLFYLVLRGLDTVEDDMTLDIETKEPLLRNFADNLEIDGWTFTQNGPNERDRELLVRFDAVVFELKKTKKEYFAIIKDITVKMGNGMADYARNSELNDHGVMTIADYEMYCHYVAGLVGEGVTRLFILANLANPALADRPELTESMGQFLQKVNIIRDIREDYDEGKKWWPKEIWSKHVDSMEDLFKPQNQTKALYCASEMILNALKHATECLYYMAAIRDQSVFNFVAIPQSMAIATLELAFMNPEIFEKNVKITKGDSCQLMMESTQNLRLVCNIFKRYGRKIHQKADPRDPNFLAIGIQCGKIEQFIERIFPTQDIKTMTAEEKAEEVQRQQQEARDNTEALYLILVVVTVLVVVGGLMVGTAWILGARFDKIAENLDMSRTTPSDTADPVDSPSSGHEEL